MWHNHPLTPEVFSTYPSKRVRTVQQENIQRAQEMDDLGVPREQVWDMLLDRGENVFKTDVDNIVGSHRARKATGDDDEATAKLLSDFSRDNEGGVITIDETDAGETGVLSITTQLMREMFERFGELLLVDCTHKTNKNNYQLCTIMVMDEFGHGQVVQQSLFERNADWHMERALDHFHRANDDAWHLVQVIMVDKDLNEIRVLSARFPNARILICLFHVLKYLGKMAFKAEFGKLSKDDHSVLETLIHNLVYSESAGAYEGNKFALEVFCERASFTKFYEYVLKNWHDCTEMWVMYQRADLPHFRNHTNNRLESYFGKFKKGVKSTSNMADCVTKLLKGARRSAQQRTYENRVGRDWNANYDEEMNNVLRFTTHFVATAVFPEYARALETNVYTFHFPDGQDGQCVQVVGKKLTHQVDLTDWSCDCAFAKSMRLPCRHAMAYRKEHGRSIIPLERIDVKWQRATRELPALKRFVVRHHPYVPGKDASAGGSPGDSRARYKEAMRLLEPICSELSEITDPEAFKEYCDFLLEQWGIVRKRIAPVVTRLRNKKDRTESQDGDLSQDEDVHQAEDGGLSQDEAVHRDDAPFELSQANSLYSPEVGSAPVINAAAVSMVEPKELIAEDNTIGHGRNMDIPRSNMDVSDDDLGEGDGQVEAESESSDTARPPFKEIVPINFNKKAPKHGHPVVDEKKVATAAKIARIQYNESQAAAKVRGVQSLRDLLDNLNEAQDGIHKTLMALACVPEKHGDCKNSKPKLESQAKPVLTTSDFFLLPKTLVSACIRKLPAETISVYTPTGVTPPPAKTSPVQVLRIATIGLFSAEQIRLMNRVIALRDACVEGEKFCEWLEESLASSVPLCQQEQLADIIEQVKERYPLATIPGIPDSHMVMVYRVMPSSASSGWFCAGLIRAFGARMEAKYEYVRFAGVFEPDPRQKKGKARQVVSGEALLHESVGRHIKENGVRIVCAIVNHGNSHWTSLVIDSESKNIMMYDSFGATARFDKMAWDLARHLGVMYDVTAINNPRQVDGHSCGILSCYKFWQKADSTIPRSMEPHALPRRQFEFLHFLMTGKIVV